MNTARAQLILMSLEETDRDTVVMSALLALNVTDLLKRVIDTTRGTEGLTLENMLGIAEIVTKRQPVDALKITAKAAAEFAHAMRIARNRYAPGMEMPPDSPMCRCGGPEAMKEWDPKDRERAEEPFYNDEGLLRIPLDMLTNMSSSELGELTRKGTVVVVKGDFYFSKVATEGLAVMDRRSKGGAN